MTISNAAIKQTAIIRAREWLDNNPLFLDTETTGLGEDARIVEIAILDSAGLVFGSLVNPGFCIPAEATAVHHITDSMVEFAPTWREIGGIVSRILQGREVVIYNADYDRRLLAQSGLINCQYRPLCCMQLYARFYGEHDPRRGTYRWQRLEMAARQCGIEIGKTHRAQDDAQLARLILLHMAQKVEGE